MPLLVNLRHLEKKNVPLKGEMSSIELGVANADELIKPGNLIYDFEAEKLEENILVQGTMRLSLECECGRCLKPFKEKLNFPHFVLHLPLEGEEKVDVINDCVDLTPHLREDILLAFPQHPVCSEKCEGLPKGAAAKLKKARGQGKIEEQSSAWAALDKLKLKHK